VLIRLAFAFEQATNSRKPRASCHRQHLNGGCWGAARRCLACQNYGVQEFFSHPPIAFVDEGYPAASSDLASSTSTTFRSSRQIETHAPESSSHQGVLLNPRHIIQHRLLLVAEREPLDVLAFA